jgi:hypothetical protein
MAGSGSQLSEGLRDGSGDVCTPPLLPSWDPGLHKLHLSVLGAPYSRRKKAGTLAPK